MDLKIKVLLKVNNAGLFFLKTDGLKMMGIFNMVISFPRSGTL